MSTNHGPGNPVTVSQLSRLDDDARHTLVEAWNALERIAVDAYRDHRNNAERRAQHSRLRGVLLKSYPGWETGIEDARRSQAAPGQNSEHHPFRQILNVSSLDGLQDDWQLKRCFPQAREALDVYLLDRLAKDQVDA
jgi:hypothetical protein